MNTRKIDLIGVASIAGAIVFVAGLFLALRQTIGVNSELGLALLAVTAGFVTGALAKTLATAARRLSRTKRIFLSYPHGHREEAYAIAHRLRDTGAKVWLDVEHLRPGDAITPVLRKAIADADQVIVLISRSPSPTLDKELEWAKLSGARIIPVIIEPGPLPSTLKDLKYIDLQADRQEGLKALVVAAAS